MMKRTQQKISGTWTTACALGALITLSACSNQVASGEEEGVDRSSSSRVSTLDFNPGFNSAGVVGRIYSGTIVPVRYATQRTQCQLETNGIAKWTLRMHYRFNGGEIHSKTMTLPAWSSGIRDATSSIEMEEAGKLELWFESSAPDVPCHSWDSNYGNNYSFTVRPGAHWMGDEGVVISEEECASETCEGETSALTAAPVEYGAEARAKSGPRIVTVDVWTPNYTDRSMSEREADGLFNPNLVYQYAVLAPSQHPVQTRSLGGKYMGRVGNNARFEFDLSELDPISEISASTGGRLRCGSRFGRVEGENLVAPVDFYLEVNGSELRPDAIQVEGEEPSESEAEGFYRINFSAPKAEMNPNC